MVSEPKPAQDSRHFEICTAKLFNSTAILNFAIIIPGRSIAYQFTLTFATMWHCARIARSTGYSHGPLEVSATPLKSLKWINILHTKYLKVVSMGEGSDKLLNFKEDPKSLIKTLAIR